MRKLKSNFYVKTCFVESVKIGMCLSTVFVVTLFAVVQANLVVNSEENLKIVGGQETNAHAFPYQVGIAIREPPQRSGWCGGALISQKFILTAAHCLKGIQLATVFIGAHDVRNVTSTPNAISIDVRQTDMLLHMRWFPRYVINDIALIRIPEPIQFGVSIQPISIATPQTVVGQGQTLIATGWGRTSKNTTIARPSKLHFVKLMVEPDTTCKDIFFYYNSTLNICLEGNSEKTTCRGDSGGPIVATDEKSGAHILVGITSYGRKCENVSVLTKVSSYLDWISARTGAV